ncbi:E3 ubiquitin-protein ligase TRIM39-like isoform X2 [Megalobrama amblycephala]|uniref:E3 ubiquitin-protein ligase TRIM39-like isoform X2 n=1 Tax=Megalobrama amblycephala TaxID=75352 RepID=UPI0020147817|nr:E3 ubiquitin-protein ligase TRIM39-like isoform X2 [Megalobrama amblycephala]XP_048034548.1 E3 ubiquitin-protein ligase TRIM39-like isoform X2 [Megalobrama amblycephala]
MTAVQRGCGSISLERPDMSDLRIVLLGKNITENNRVGNFILGRAAFESEGPADVDLNIEKYRGKLKDRDITVINTHLLRPNLSITQITQGVKECVNLSAPGPHVIILVLQQNDFSDNNKHRVKYVLNEFSKEALKHTIVLTDEREINNNCIHQLIKECGGEHLQFDERKSGLHSEILERVEKILKENQDQFLISDLYEEAGEETPEDGEKSRSGDSVTAEEEGDFDHEDDGKIKQRNKEKKEVAAQRKTLFMASSSGPALNEELQCSICLVVFTDPVTTPCGHNFCSTCLSKCWTNTQTCFCPFCKEEFSKRLNLKINSTLGKLVQHFNKLNQESKVFCDFCDERKQKAVKSCLTCQSSYCVSHLELHLRVPCLKKHTLINAVENLEDYICQKHERPLEMFCRDDQTCVCLFCTEGEHRTHNTVPIEEESQEKKTQTDEQQKIQKRIKKIQEIKHSVKPRKTLASNDGFFTSSRTVHISNGMIIGLGVLLVAVLIILPTQYTRYQSEQLKMKEQQKAAEKQAEDLIKELKRNNTELEKRITELEQLSHTDDHPDVIQMFSSLYSISHTKISDVDEKSLKRALNLLKEHLNEKLIQTELKFVQKFAVGVTLDPDTANPYLILSDDGKQVRHGDIKQNVPENPKRFDYTNCVLAKQGFSSGRFYYEVQVKGKTNWDLGVARESIYRKGEIILSPGNGFWTVVLRNENQYIACDNPVVSLSLRVKPEKVGVFVDYEEGLVSFYDVDSRSHIYSFTGQTFTEKLYPYFSPFPNDKGKNSKPLIITPVN